MNHKFSSPKLQDVSQLRQLLVGAASDLGTISSGNLLIAAADIKPNFAASDVVHAKNETLGELLSASVSGSDLVLDGATAITAGHVITIVIKLA